jgi:polar amino acid transport system substrate-binding protein
VKLATVLLLAIPMMLWGSAAIGGETLDRINRTKELVEVVDPSYPPFTFLNDKSQMDGFDIDVAKAVAERFGVRLRIETPSWEVVAAGHWRGRWDVCICSMTPDKQKAQVLDFVVPYYNSPVVLISTAQNTTLHSLGDISGKRVGVEQGSSYERYLQKDLVIAAPGARPLSYPFDKVRIAPYGSEDLAFQDLALGAGKRIDAIVSNYGTAKARLDKTPGKFRIVGEPLYVEPNWIAIDKGDPEWKLRLTQVIGDLKKDGTLSRLSTKWLGKDITQ